jgi:phage terminase large subunit
MHLTYSENDEQRDYNVNEEFNQVIRDILPLPHRFIINYGGTGSGKSYAAAQKEVLIAAKHANIKTLVIRKVAATLKDSVIPSFRSRIAELDLDDRFRFYKTDRLLECTHNGSQIVFRGLDDPDKLKSFEGLQRILVEEAAELEFEDFLELNRRARGRDNIQITLCFNPVHEEHWLKKHFFDQDMADMQPVHSTYHKNPFLTEKDKEQIEWLQRYNNNQYRIYALGEWGMQENDNPWLFAFSKQKHVKEDIAFQKTYPVYLSFDFNRDPVTCLAAQMTPLQGTRDSFLHFIQEFKAQSLEQLCMQIKARFPASIFYVTGDASGNNGNIGFTNRHATYYKMVQSYLQLTDKLMNLNSYNLEHHDSRNLVNMLLAKYPNVYISQKGCPTLVNDCIIAKVDETTLRPGVLKKDRSLYKMDMFDCFRYFFQTYFKDHVNKVWLRKAA